MNGLGTMNTLDYAIAAVTVMGTLYGFSRGVFRMATSALSLLGGLYAASIYYPVAGNFVAKQLGANPTAAEVIGYVAVFTIVFIGIEIGGTIVIRVLRSVHMGWVDRMAGGLIGGAITAAVLGLLVMALALILPAQGDLLRRSILAPDLLAYDDALVEYIPAQVKEAYQARRSQLLAIWQQQALRRSAKPAPAPSPTPN